MPQPLPLLSFVLVTPDSYATIRRTVMALQRQTIAQDCELVIAAPVAKTLGLIEADMSAFGSYQIAETGPVRSVGQRRATGIRAASAPIVAMCEDHCFPDPTWAAALLKRHAEPHAAVAACLDNANPRTMLSWASLLLAYAAFVNARSGRIDCGPGHNTSYKRDKILPFGDRLGDLLDVEPFLHAALVQQGETIYLESDARTRHLNASTWKAHLAVWYTIGRIYGARRAASFSLPKRLFYAAASAAVPFLRLRRTIGQVREVGLSDRLLPRIIPALFAGLAANALGESMACLFGAGRSMDVVFDQEFHRERLMCAADIADLPTLPPIREVAFVPKRRALVTT